MTKISALPTDSAPTGDDLIPAVDATTNTTKKITINSIDVLASMLSHGYIYRRQGGSSTNWNTTGTTTYDTSALEVIVQVGSSVSAASDKTVTFPVAFTQPPLIFVTLASAAGFNGTARAINSSTTGFDFRFLDTGWVARAGETISWMAIGI